MYSGLSPHRWFRRCCDDNCCINPCTPSQRWFRRDKTAVRLKPSCSPSQRWFRSVMPARAAVTNSSPSHRWFEKKYTTVKGGIFLMVVKIKRLWLRTAYQDGVFAMLFDFQVWRGKQWDCYRHCTHLNQKNSNHLNHC